MSQRDSKSPEVEVRFGFEIGERKFEGIVGLGNEGKILALEVHASKYMRPIDVEKVLYQVAHLIAEKTDTLKQFKQEKMNVWN
jgi:hypothetical protein